MNEDFLDFLNALLASGTRFLIVGAHALAVHGVVRATGDLDVWIANDENNVARLRAALRAFGAPLDTLGFPADGFVEPDTVWQIGIPPRRIDILTSIDGVDFDEAWGQRRTVTWQEIEAPVLGLESLRRNKAATGREKDRMDLDLLRRVPE